MDSENCTSNKERLIKNLEILCYLESEKPISEMDTDLIKVSVDFISELLGEEVTLTPEEIEEKVRKIPFVETATLNTTPTSVKGKTTKVKSHKILLIAAIISILVAIFTITSIAFDWNIFDELKNRFGTVADAPVNEDIDVNGITVVSNGKSTVYIDLETALKNENAEVLYPTKLPPNTTLYSISFYKMNSKNKITFLFNDEELLYSVTLNEKLSTDIKSVANEVLTFNSIDFYVTNMTDIGVYQIHFEHNENLYLISYTNKQDLIKIIKNLKELQ